VGRREGAGPRCVGEGIVAEDADGWTEEEGETLVGLWDCKRCGHVGNSGLSRTCAGCGAPRDEDVAFYLPGEGRQEVVTDAETLRAADAGPDWVCEHCGAGNTALVAACSQCGAPRGSSPTLSEKLYAPGAEPHSDREARGEVPAAPAPPKRRRGRGGLVLAALAVLLAVVLPLLLRPRAVPATVTALTWERTVAVEENRRFVEEGWDVPGGGHVLDRSIRIRSYHSVLDHYEDATKTVTKRVQTGTRTVRVRSGTRDKGNGTFRAVYKTRTEPVYETRSERVRYRRPVYRQVPVPRTWYRYEVWRWTHSRDARASGALPQAEPFWPDPHLVGRERDGERRAVYHVSLRTPDGQARETDLPEERWRSLSVGGRCTLRTNAFGSVLGIE
jgi:hypothetical protein